jgi:hypothetical protein
MKSKFITSFLISLLFLLVALVSPVQASLLRPATDSIPANEEARVKILTQRLEEIKSTDKTTLSRVEKKGLRKETKDIKKEIKSMSNGVYISIGALIIIILLLILIL